MISCFARVLVRLIKGGALQEACIIVDALHVCDPSKVLPNSSIIFHYHFCMRLPMRILFPTVMLFNETFSVGGFSCAFQK